MITLDDRGILLARTDRESLGSEIRCKVINVLLAKPAVRRPLFDRRTEGHFDMEVFLPAREAGENFHSYAERIFS